MTPHQTWISQCAPSWIDPAPHVKVRIHMHYLFPWHNIWKPSISGSYVIIDDHISPLLSNQHPVDPPYYVGFLPYMSKPSRTYPTTAKIHLTTYQPSTCVHCSTTYRYTIHAWRTPRSMNLMRTSSIPAWPHFRTTTLLPRHRYRSAQEANKTSEN
jgi:hypothetical protein